MDQTKELSLNEYAVTYLGHSGWAIETVNSIVVFDYSPDAPGASEKSSGIMESLLSHPGKKIFFLASHEHDDHFHKEIFKWEKLGSNMRYFLGWPYEHEKEAPSTSLHTFHPGETLTENAFELYTIPATDEGSAFLLKLDGFSFCHLGDHGNWAPELTEEFCELLEPFQKNTEAIDALFLPVLKGNGARPESMTLGGKLCIEIFSPAHVFPMHGGGREGSYADFRKDMTHVGLGDHVHCALNIGDRWTFSKRKY